MGLDFFTTADMLGKMFWVCSLAGTLFFLLRVIMMFVGGDLEDGGDGDFADASDVAFEVFSINSITAFVMMFGWAGLTAHVQYQLGQVHSMVIALIVAVLAMLATAYLFQLAMKLVSHGAQFKLEQAVGLKAKVYQQIPADGSGKIQLTIPGGMTREIDAVSDQKVLIESFKTVTVTSVVDSDTLAVTEDK